MASTIKLKRSSIAGKIPTTSDVATAELAVNLKDARLYSANSSSVFEIGANPHSLSIGSGSFTFANGAITFPTSAGTAGQTLQMGSSGQLAFAYANATTTKSQISTLSDDDYVVTEVSSGSYTRVQVSALSENDDVVTNVIGTYQPQLGNYVSIASLKSIAADSATFSEFKSAIAAL
tara:strand:- start:473 stop:1003 length:531 start_codon:yes stop_codon:yes gene_type:complete